MQRAPPNGNVAFELTDKYVNMLISCDKYSEKYRFKLNPFQPKGTYLLTNAIPI